MKKTARAIAIIATGILALSSIALLLCIIFQRPLLDTLYGYDYWQSWETLYVPVHYLVQMCLLVSISGVLCFTVCSKKLGSWAEILGTLLITIVVPMLTNVIWTIQMQLFSYGVDSVSMSYYSMVYSLCSRALTFVDFATMLLVLACGMSIAYKHLTRKAGVCEENPLPEI